MVYFFTKMLQGIVWIVITLFQGFVWFIDICDVVLTTGFIWLLMHKIYGWNGWWALALGLLISLVLYIIFKHRIGFWVVAPLFSAIWTLVFSAFLEWIFPTLPEILFWIICGAHFLWGIRCHDYARYRKETDDICKAEEAEKKRLAQEELSETHTGRMPEDYR